jgi:prepilin-type N-terminal cleavage/methylation domain-containing protein
MLLSNRPINGVARRSLKRRGFSLVEVLVAVMILGMMATGMATFTGYVGKSRILGRQRSLALVVAQEAIETARSRPFAQTIEGTTVENVTVARFPLVVTTIVEAHGPNMRTVKVAVRNSGSSQLQGFTTTVFR